MKQTLVRRLEALEERRAQWQRPAEPLSTFELARRTGFTLALGAHAKKELDSGGLDSARRAELAEQLDMGRSMAELLATP